MNKLFSSENYILKYACLEVSVKKIFKYFCKSVVTSINAVKLKIY